MTPASRKDGTVHSAEEGRSVFLCSRCPFALTLPGRQPEKMPGVWGVAQATDQIMAQFSLYHFYELYSFSTVRSEQGPPHPPACHFWLQALVLKGLRETNSRSLPEEKPTHTLEKIQVDEKTA